MYKNILEYWINGKNLISISRWEDEETNYVSDYRIGFEQHLDGFHAEVHSLNSYSKNDLIETLKKLLEKIEKM